MAKFRQRGENGKFPEKIETWKLGEEVPTWLSDIASVKFLDGNGNITLNYLDTSTGGIEIFESGSSTILIRLNSKSDLVCRGVGKNIFCLSEIQLELLYLME